MLLVVIGAVNWGLVGLAHFFTDGSNWNVVNQVVGGYPTVEFGIYLLVGLAGLVLVGLVARGFVSPEADVVDELESEPQA